MKLNSYFKSGFMELNSLSISVILFFFISFISLFAQDKVPFQTLEKRIPASTIPASSLDLTKNYDNSGNVSFPMPLLSIGGVNVELSYSSAGINKQIRTENQYAPSGSVGIGWSLSVGSISAEINNSEDVSDDRYFYTGSDGNFELKQDASGVFLVPGAKLWKIERVMNVKTVAGWIITKEDGTKMRFGNYHRSGSTYTFSVSNDSTFATRFYLGYNGLVVNPAPTTYPNMTLIPYQWDLSDVQDIYGNHTTLIYKPELVSLKTGTDSTQVKYTRQSHPYKILDNMGTVVEFDFQTMESSAEYPLYPQTYSQYLVEKRYLNAISIYGNVINGTGQLNKKISYSYQVSDILNLGIIKRYLNGFTIKDKNNNSLPSYSFTYYGSSDIYPGAVKNITDSKGGQISYTYKTQTLTDITLQKTEEIDQIDYWREVHGTSMVEIVPHDDGFAGKNFVCVRSVDKVLHVFRRGPKSWYKDTSFPVVTTSQVRVCNDYITYWDTTTAMVARLQNDHWETYNITAALGTPGYSSVIGVYSNYFVVRYNLVPNSIRIDDIDVTINSWDLAIVMFTDGGLKAFNINTPDENNNLEQYWDGFAKDNVEKRAEIRTFCGQNYLVVESFGGPTYFGRPRFSHFRFKDIQSGWEVLKNKEDEDLVQGLTDRPYIGFGKNFLVCAGKGKIIVYRPNGTQLDTIDQFYYAPDITPGYVVGDDYYAFTVAFTFGIHEGVVIKTWSGTSFNTSSFSADSSGNYAISSIGNRLIISWTNQLNTDISKKYRRMGYMNYSPSSGWSSFSVLDNVYFGPISFCDWRSSAVGISSNAFAAMWYRKQEQSGEGNYQPLPTSLRTYTFNGNSVTKTIVDEIPLRSKYYVDRWIYEDATNWALQPGDNYLVVNRPDSWNHFQPDSVNIYSFVTKPDGTLQFKGNPTVIVVDQKTVNNGVGDTYTITYSYEKGAHTEQLSTAYNKVTESLPNNGKTTQYYYNDLGTGEAENFIAASNYKELDGLTYKSEVYNQSDALLQATTNYWSGIEINDALGIYFKQMDSTATTIDGVKSSTAFTYNNINRLPSETTERVGVSTNTGTNKNKVSQVKYAYEQYSGMNASGAHMLVQPYETRIYESGNSTPVSQTQTIYNSSAPYLPIESKVWDGSRWITTNTIISRDTKGNITETQDANGIRTSNKWGYNGSVPIAQIINAKGGESGYTGLENYSFDGWEAGGSTFNTTTYHTGNSSAYCNNDYGPTKNFYCSQGLDKTKSYIFEAWVNRATGTATATITIEGRNSSNQVILSKSSTVNSGAGWQLISLEITPQDMIDLPSDGYLRVWCGFISENNIGYVDDVRFRPANSQMVTAAYDPVSLVMTSHSDANNNPVYYTYDGFGRLTSTKGPDGQQVSANSYPDMRTVNTTLSQSPNPDIFKQDITDGFGKPLQQKVGYITTSQTYDDGRLWLDYQPSGYATEKKYFTDPLGRVEKQGGYNSSVWNINTGHHLSYSYGANASTDVSGYSANKLFKTTITDENGKVSSEYKDALGNVIQKVQNVVVPQNYANTENLTTKFEYNILGNLTKSTPPNGSAFSTSYSYNALGQVTQKTTPDAGTTTYIYDEAGNLRFTRDANQSAAGKFTYNKYDALNRLTESGEYTVSGSFTQTNADNNDFPLTSDANKVLNQQLYYDNQYDGNTQNNLKGKVSKSVSYRQGTAICTTYYSYDAYGRTEWMLTKMPGISDKKISYWYNRQGSVTKKCVSDLGSNVLYTYYSYDAAVKLNAVYSNTVDNTSTWKTEALYSYNNDGTVRRLQLGLAQGVDYLYNERSWLTQINHQNLDALYNGVPQDPGGDGHNGIPGDRFGEVIGYNELAHIGNTVYGFNAQAQYNGNISWIITRTDSVPLENTAIEEPCIGYVYNYDGANRLTKADFGYWNNSVWTNHAMYDLPSMSYDANGNILALQRKGYDGLWLDKFAYTYNSGTNKLQMITNTANEFPEQYSYTYDANGNVKTDVYRSVTNANYNNQNLPIQLTVNGVTVNYWYDAAGNRIRKIAGDIDEIYVLGISGQTEAVFTANGSLKFFNINTGTENLGKYEPLMPDLTLSNKTLVGNYLANNITAQTNVLVTGTATLKAGNKITLKPGFRAASGCTFKGIVDSDMVATSYYYVKDHLGSTRVTVDEKGAIASYDDYDPWGMQLDMRSSNAGMTNDKYKFTGKERDIETNYDYFGARFYDSRIARWLQVDPLAKKHMDVSPYAYVINNPLRYFDPDGRTEKERKNAVQAARNLIGTPYKKMDCSHLVARAIQGVGFSDLRTRGSGADGAKNGVAMIVGNSREVALTDARVGDAVTFRTTRRDHKGPDGKYDHIALVTEINKDENGNISEIGFIHSGSSSGVSEFVYTGDTKGRQLTGVYQWDTPDDPTIYDGGKLPEVVVIATPKPAGPEPKPLEFKNE